MSGMGQMMERTVTAVLLSLWRQPETTVQGLLRTTLAPLPEVQRALEILQEQRCLIEHLPGGGVRLAATGLACWRDVLEEVASTEERRIGKRVMVFARTGSTNDVAWQCAAFAEHDGLVVVADEQAAGRGRLGHAWVAKAEQSVLCSLLLRDMPAASVDRLTLLAGLAAARGVEQVLAEAQVFRRVEIKWPNDLLIGGKKLAGILVERRGEHVVVGLGINVAQAAGDFPAELGGRATSVYLATGVLIDRLRIVAAVLRELEAVMGKGVEDEWMGEWKGRCSMLGTRVEVRVGEHRVRGVVVDIDPLRGLAVRDEGGGGATHFLSAQTSTLAV